MTDTIHEHESEPTLSEAKLSSNRLNALKSSGPKTPEGKRRSSLNAFRSGLHGQITSLPAEDLAAYQKQLDETLAEYNPVGPTERFYAVSVAENMFRIFRCRALENGIFANGFRARIDSIDAGHPEVDASLAAAQTFEEQSRQLALLTLYEGRLRRTLEKDLAALKALQAERKAKYEKAADQATAFLRYAGSRGEMYEPGDDFQPASDWGGFLRICNPDYLESITYKCARIAA
jgi:hypothetical protein